MLLLLLLAGCRVSKSFAPLKVFNGGRQKGGHPANKQQPHSCFISPKIKTTNLFTATSATQAHDHSSSSSVVVALEAVFVDKRNPTKKEPRVISLLRDENSKRFWWNDTRTAYPEMFSTVPLALAALEDEDEESGNEDDYRRLPWNINFDMFRGMYANPTIVTNLTRVPYAHAPLGIVHPDSKFAQSPHATLLYDVVGTKAERIPTGKNYNVSFTKYYMMQVVEYSADMDTESKFGVLFKWGLEGTPGFAQEVEFDTREEAMDCFRRKYRQKMGRRWDDEEEAEENAAVFAGMDNDNNKHYERTYSLEHDTDARDVLLTRDNTNDNDHEDPSIIALSFDQPKLGEYVVETSVYNPKLGVKSSASRFMFKDDMAKADEQFRWTFSELTGGVEWHRRRHAVTNAQPGKFYQYQRTRVPAAVFAGLASNPTIRMNLTNVIQTNQALTTVDSESKFASKGHILELDGEPATAMLIGKDDNEEEVEGGLSKFYSIQLVAVSPEEDTSNTTYGVVTRWGPIDGTSPGFMQELTFDNSKDAEQRFLQKFREKTGLSWDNKTQQPVGSSSSSKKKTKKKNPKYSMVGSMPTEREADRTTVVPGGVVDWLSKVNGGRVVLHDDDGEPLDVMLALVDPAKSLDRFVVLQLLVDNTGAYHVFQREGTTGTNGTITTLAFANETIAKAKFFDVLKDKIGYSWEDRFMPTKGDKFRFVVQDFAAKQLGYSAGKWQYWVDDFVDGKATGWYNYTDAGGRHVEQLFTEKNFNANLANRIVQSGQYKYDVDLDRMVQTNAVHPSHTSRRIRRLSDVLPIPSERKKKPKIPPPVTYSPLGDEGDDSESDSDEVSSDDEAVAHLDEHDDDEETLSHPQTHKATSPLNNTQEKEDDDNDNDGSADKQLAADTKEGNNVEIHESTSDKLDKTSSVDLEEETEPARTKADRSAENHPVDPTITIRLTGGTENYTVVFDSVEDKWYDAVLNQCDIGANSNKYIRLQVVSDDQRNAYVWQRWGRVGDVPGLSTSKLTGPLPLARAKSLFNSKYKAKTSGLSRGKYQPIEIDNNAKSTVSEEDKEANVEYDACRLDQPTERLMGVLFSKETRDTVLDAFGIDLKRLPLGVPARSQIGVGVSVLDKIDQKIKGNQGIEESFSELSSMFYTAIPHSYSRFRRPPLIDTPTSLQAAYDKCDVLTDMCSTTETLRDMKTTAATKKVPHPTDQWYASLNADLQLLSPDSSEYEMIAKYFNATKETRKRLLNVWKVDRENEERRHLSHFEQTENRRLLWHGTNIAVVAPILTSGLRIMPHSGGRVGSGIYMASMCAKSLQYTPFYNTKFSCMMLCEAALGNVHNITRDDSSLRQAPAGADSVLAVGSVSPSEGKALELDGRDVLVPQSGGVSTGVDSYFHHDEFVVYNATQLRIRYLVSVK